MKEYVIFDKGNDTKTNEFIITVDYSFFGLCVHGWENWSWKKRDFCIGLTIIFFDFCYMNYNHEL